MSTSQTQILVIGAGYSGLLATTRLAAKTRRQKVNITLVNPMATFVERLRLHQYAANQPVKQRSIAETLLGTGVEFLQASVTAIDTQRHEVVAQTDSGPRRLPYDYILYTAGSTIDRDSVPGVRENAHTLTPTGPLSAEAMRGSLPELNRRAGRLVVVGGGATGIEAAAEFAESYPNLQVSLVTHGELAGFWGGKIQSHIVKTLTRLGVAIRDQMEVVRVEPGALVTSTGDSIPFDLCLWAGGFSVPALARASGLAVNERGQVIIDPYMRSISHPEIYAAGDSARPVDESRNLLRMAALTAVITGAHAADCLANAVNGRPQKPLDFAYVGQGIALGRHDAIGFNNFPDDQPRAPYFTGLAGFYGREFFVDVLARLPGLERRLPGVHFWPGRYLFGMGTTPRPQSSPLGTTPKQDRAPATTASRS
jgi:NADH dehydrogenase FAD-containing subunit